jgi:hypothetical protein
MKRFADLYDEIDRTTSTNAKVAALVKYLTEAPPADAAWALFFLTGRRLKRHLPARSMHEWTLELTRLPEWLVQESYSVVGDFAETIALLVDGRAEPFDPGIGDRGSGTRDSEFAEGCRSMSRRRSSSRRKWKASRWRNGSSGVFFPCARCATTSGGRMCSPGGRDSSAASCFS